MNKHISEKTFDDQLTSMGLNNQVISRASDIVGWDMKAHDRQDIRLDRDIIDCLVNLIAFKNQWDLRGKPAINNVGRYVCPSGIVFLRFDTWDAICTPFGRFQLSHESLSRYFSKHIYDNTPYQNIILNGHQADAYILAGDISSPVKMDEDRYYKDSLSIRVANQHNILLHHLPTESWLYNFIKQINKEEEKPMKKAIIPTSKMSSVAEIRKIMKEYDNTHEGFFSNRNHNTPLNNDSIISMLAIAFDGGWQDCNNDVKLKDMFVTIEDILPHYNPKCHDDMIKDIDDYPCFSGDTGPLVYAYQQGWKDRMKLDSYPNFDKDSFISLINK